MGAALLAWFVMQSRMDVALAWERERLASQRESVAAQRAELQARHDAMETSVECAVRAAEESARRQSLESFLQDIRVERRCILLEGRRPSPEPGRQKSSLAKAVWNLLTDETAPTGKRLLLRERICFRQIPLSNWTERELPVEEGTDVGRLVRELSAPDDNVVSIADIPRAMQAIGAAS